MDGSSSWLDFMIDIDTPPTNQVRDRSWLRYLKKYENRNSKWRDSVTIKWNTEERIPPIHSIADQWVLYESIKNFSNPTAQSINELVKSLYELNSSHTNNKSVAIDDDPEPASDIEIEELLGIQRGDTVSSL